MVISNDQQNAHSILFLWGSDGVHREALLNSDNVAELFDKTFMVQSRKDLERVATRGGLARAIVPTVFPEMRETKWS